MNTARHRSAHRVEISIHRLGFTIVELMIVVAIISIVMAIALPSIFNTRITANEAKAVTSLRALHAAEEMYRLRTGRYAHLSNLKANGFIDGFEDYQTGNLEKSGYGFFYHFLSSGRWRIRANPRDPGTTGSNYYAIYDDGIIRFSSTRAAGINDAPLD